MFPTIYEDFTLLQCHTGRNTSKVDAKCLLIFCFSELYIMASVLVTGV